MADLVAVQPNLNIALYLVAPDERRHKVFEELGRPTFSRLSPSLAEVCHYISFETLRAELTRVGRHARHLKLSFLAVGDLFVAPTYQHANHLLVVEGPTLRL